VAGSVALAFDILARDRASKEFDKVSRSAESTGRKLSNVGKIAASALGGAALGGIAAFTGGLVGGFKEAVSYQKITDQLAQTIKATGGAAGVSVGGLKTYAGQLESMSGVDEELILSSQNVLATFTQIQNKVGKGNDVFNQASLAALNMSTTLGTDVNGAAVQVGKALNDPIKGITALSKAGVSFTAQQKAQIKTMVASGNTLGAQKLILGELNKEFGGAAAAAGKGFGGTMARLKDTISDTFRDIATRALPTLTRLAEFLAAFLPKAISVASNAFGYIGKALSPVSRAFSDFTSGVQGVGPAADGIWSFARQAGLGVRALIRAFQDGDVTSDGLVGSFERVGVTLRSMVGWFRGQLVPAVKNLAAMFTPLLQGALQYAVVAFGLVVVAVQKVAAVLLPLTNFLRDHKTVVQALAVGIGAMVLAVQAWSIATGIASAVTGVFASAQAALNVVLAMNPIGLVVIALIGLAAALVYAWKHSETFRNIVTGAFSAVTGAVSATFNWIKGHWPLLLGILAGPFGLAIGLIVQYREKIVGAIKAMPQMISSAASGMWDGIKNAFKSAINWIIGKWNGLQFKLPSVDTHIPGVGTVGGFTLGTPDIPRLAKGGIVNRPTLALIGEAGPEAVVPLSRGTGGSRGGDVHITFTGLVTDPVATGREIEKILTKLRRERGTSLGFT
jgi:phage-related protein